MKTKLLRHKHSHIIFPFIVISILLLGIALSLIQTQQQQQSTTQAQAIPEDNCAVSESDIVRTDNEKILFDGINNYRQEKGKGTLVWNPDLKKSAKWLASDMQANNYLSHVDSLGRGTGKRLKDCDFNANASWGENVAVNNGGSPLEILQMWQNSTGHNANLLDNSFTQMGIAQSGGYWTYNAAGGTPPTPAIEPTADPDTTITPTGTSSATTNTPAPSTSPGTTNETNPSTTPGQPQEAEGTPTPTPRRAVDMKITVSIKLPGIGTGGNQSPRNSSRKILVTIYGLDNQEVVTGTGFATYDGNDLFKGLIHLGSMNEGIYYIKVVEQAQISSDLIQSVTLQSFIEPQFQKLSIDSENVLPPVTLIQGDLDTDNALTINDYNLALTCFQAKGCVRDPSIAGTYDRIDLNDDAEVNVFDYNVLLRNFWEHRGD